MSACRHMGRAPPQRRDLQPRSRPCLFWRHRRLRPGDWAGWTRPPPACPRPSPPSAALLLVYRIGDRLFGRRAGWLAATAFATCFKILWQGRFGQIDMLLTALVTLGVWFWVRGLDRGAARPPPAVLPLRRLRHPGQGAGRPAAAPALDPRLPAATRNTAEIRRMRIPLGLLIWAAVVLAWLVPAALAAGPDYLRTIVFKQNVTRYADPWHHFAPWYYYLTVIPAEFFPWSFLLPTARGGLEAAGRQGAAGVPLLPSAGWW